MSSMLHRLSARCPGADWPLLSCSAITKAYTLQVSTPEGPNIDLDHEMLAVQHREDLLSDKACI